jgi:carboxyl-terminal processing protease
MMNVKGIFKSASLMAVAAIGLLACGGDDSPSKNEYVNKWVLNEMQLYYLWNDELPSSPNKSVSPPLFFESLLSDEDRFSWIQEDYLELLNSLQGINKEAGYEFKLYRESSANENVIAQVMYVKTGSPAALLDLERGDVISHVNGQQMTLSNYQSLLSLMSENHTIKYSRHNGTAWTDKGTLSLTTVEFAENPNFMNKTFDYPNGKKIGYFVYNFFATGPSEGNLQYNTQMETIFAGFKSAAITDLIVDLRFNSGGAESATIKLASLIGTGVDNTKVFVRREFNEGYEDALVDYYGPDILIRKFENNAQNVGGQISNKVYILTSNRTASASELLINGLRPYMDVIIIGDTTVGKNVGSITRYKPNDSKNTWGIQPIVTKSYNSLNQSDYGNGFIPTVADRDNALVIKELGDSEENLLSKAIAEITGVGGRKEITRDQVSKEMIGTSLDRKRGKFNLLIDDERLQNVFKQTEQLP